MVFKELSKAISVVIAASLALLINIEQPPQVSQWLMYENPEEAGYSQEDIDYIDSMFRATQGSAAMLIVKDHIVWQWGEIERRFMCHSVRKSLLNALYGVYVTKGEIDITKTIGEIGIDDKDSLSELEKSATIEQLLSARSGVFHPAAYETPAMRQFRPDRDSKKPGEFWFYNNWDFNTLMTIFEKETGKKFFDAFYEDLALPLGMQDFRVYDGYYHLEAHNSLHPAYPFKMSARDMAKIGMLFDHDGEWKGKQIISKDWIEQSTRQITEDLGRYEVLDGYGLLWWVYDEIEGQKVYTAAGVGGQHITVIPDLDIVYVQRANTYDGKTISEGEHEVLFSEIIKRKKRTKPNAKLRRITSNTAQNYVDALKFEKVTGAYNNNELGPAELKASEQGDLIVAFDNFGTFNIKVNEDGTFLLEDIEVPIYLNDSTASGIYTLNPTPDNQLESMTFYY